MDKKYGWCILGTGMIAHQVAPQIMKHNDRSYIATVWNRTSSKAVKFSKKFKCKQYDNLEDAVMDKNVDLIYVALNHHVHYEYLKKLIKYHKPILCEKPFTLNSKEAKEIFELAKAEGTYVAEAMWTWHNEPAIKCKTWLDDNEIGNIKEVNIIYSNPFMYLLPLKRLKDINLGGGALLDSGVYPITYAYRLFGYPKKIECIEFGFIKEVDSKESIVFHYDNFKVNIVCNLVGKFNEVVEIIGDNGKIIVPDFHFGNKAHLYKDNKVIKFRSGYKGYYREIVHTELDQVDGLKESRYVPASSTIDCLRIMDEIRDKMKLVYPSELK